MKYTLPFVISLAQARLPVARIVGGAEVAPKFKYPWMASLQFDGSHACGGTWYTGNAIISAAHCVFGELSDWVALSHRHNLDLGNEEEGGVSYPILGVRPHPHFDRRGGGSNDVSVWYVEAKASPPGIVLDTGSYSATEDTLLTLIGWGFTQAMSSVSPVLLEVNVPVYNSATCKKAYPTLNTTTQFCAGYPEGRKDACTKDSGGPIFVSSGGSYTLVGVVSFGKGCADRGFPGVYTRISAVAEFITSSIEY